MRQCASWKQFPVLGVGRMCSTGVWWPYEFSDLKRQTSEFEEAKVSGICESEKKKTEAVHREHLFSRNVQANSRTYMEIPSTENMLLNLNGFFLS